MFQGLAIDMSPRVSKRCIQVRGVHTCRSLLQVAVVLVNGLRDYVMIMMVNSGSSDTRGGTPYYGLCAGFGPCSMSCRVSDRHRRDVRRFSAAVTLMCKCPLPYVSSSKGTLCVFCFLTTAHPIMKQFFMKPLRSACIRLPTIKGYQLSF